MNCTRCQTANDPGATFCANCGTSLIPAASAGYVGPTSYETPAAPRYQQGQSGPFVQRSSALPPANFDLRRLTTVDRIIAGATLVTMISLWLPWYTGKDSVLGITSTASISGTGDHGWLWLEFILALALLGYFTARAAWEQLPFSLPVSDEWLLIGGTGLQFLLILIGFIALPSTDGIQGFSVSWDFGAFLALIASIVAAAPVAYPAVKTYLDSRRASAPRPS
jgi:zinc-ribbon domain